MATEYEIYNMCFYYAKNVMPKSSKSISILKLTGLLDQCYKLL